MGLEQGEVKAYQTTGEVNDRGEGQGTADIQPTTNEVETKGHIVIPFTQGLGKSIKKICSRYGIQTYFKGNNTIKNLLVSPKDKDPWLAKMGSSIGSNMGTLHVMMNIKEKLLGPLEKDSRST